MAQQTHLLFTPFQKGKRIPEEFSYDKENWPIIKFFNESAASCVQENISKVFIIQNQENTFLGYIALSLCSIKKNGLRKEKARAPFERPAIRIGQLIIDKKSQGKGYGTTALKFVINIAKTIEKLVPCRLLVVDPLTEKVKAFYKKNRFEESPDGTLIFDLAQLLKENTSEY